MKSELVVVISFDSHNTTFASWHIFACHNALRLFKNSHNMKFRVVAVSLLPQRAVFFFSAQWAFSITQLNIYIKQNHLIWVDINFAQHVTHISSVLLPTDAMTTVLSLLRMRSVNTFYTFSSTGENTTLLAALFSSNSLQILSLWHLFSIVIQHEYNCDVFRNQWQSNIVNLSHRPNGEASDSLENIRVWSIHNLCWTTVYLLTMFILLSE